MYTGIYMVLYENKLIKNNFILLSSEAIYPKALANLDI